MKFTLNHEEFLQYKYNNKSLLSLKLKRLFENELFKKSLISIGESSIMIILNANNCYAIVLRDS